MDSKTVKYYKKKTIAQLHKLATKHFNEFIRNRDKNKPCISCGTFTTLQAGHFYSAGHFPNLRYNENNVHGQCVRCNHFLSGNLSEYRKNILTRISESQLIDLDFKVKYYKRSGYKWDKFYLIEIIEKYK